MFLNDIISKFTKKSNLEPSQKLFIALYDKDDGELEDICQINYHSRSGLENNYESLIYSNVCINRVTGESDEMAPLYNPVNRRFEKLSEYDFKRMDLAEFEDFLSKKPKYKKFLQPILADYKVDTITKSSGLTLIK